MTDQLRDLARSYFPEDTHPAHDWYHVKRVETLATRLANDRDDIDGAILETGVLLHDIGRSREAAGEIDDHATWGAREASRLLTETLAGQVVMNGSDADDPISAVEHAIRAHRYSNDVEPETIEAKLLSDADNLDAMGAVGLARCFSYSGESGISIYDPSLPPEADDSPAGRTGVNHVAAKLLTLPDRMYTEHGRRLADERGAFLERYLDQFRAEIAGET